MRHIEIRDLWLQKEVMKCLMKIVKIPGDENPADLMTKFLKVEIIDQRLKEMNLKRVLGIMMSRRSRMCKRRFRRSRLTNWSRVDGLTQVTEMKKAIW